jgi:YegS/Rv2252/BmrU family lipid kinase
MRSEDQMRRIGVIINVSAGATAGSELADNVYRLFEQHDCSPRVELARGSRIREVARAMRDEQFDIIVAGGGDGTVSAVASQLVESDAALGVLPLGTLNHFARDLGLPLDLDKAVEAICSGEVTSVDAASVNGKTFINNSSLGLYPDQASLRKKWRARIGRWPALVVASFIVLARFPFVRVLVEFNGQRISRRCPMMMISNNEYALEPGKLTERDRLDSGTLGVYLLRDEGRTGLLKIALHSLVYSPEDAASFENYRAEEVVVRTRRRSVRVALDGEVVRLRTPLQYRSLPRSLRVITAGVRGQGSGVRD